MTTEQRRVLGGVLLAVLVICSILLLRSLQGSAVRDDSKEITSPQAGSLVGAALDPPLSRLERDTVTDAVQGPPGSPAPATSLPIRGQVVFLDDGELRPANRDLTILTDTPVFLASLENHEAPDLRSTPTTSFAPDDAGSFVFWPPTSIGAVAISAVGAGCAARADETAKPGDAVTISMGYLYACEVLLVDSLTHSPIEKSSELTMAGFGTNWEYVDPCLPGIRSRLARPVLLSANRSMQSDQATRHLVWSETEFKNGVRLACNAVEPGYKRRSTKIPMPLFNGTYAVIPVELERNSEKLIAIEFLVEREGDWAGVADFEYRTISNLLIRSEANPSNALEARLTLSPGRHLLRGIPFEDPIVEFEIAEGMRGEQAGRPFQSLELAGPASAGLPFTSNVDCSTVCAVWVPPLKDPIEEYAWLALTHVDYPGETTGYRYSAAKGFLLDGFLPGRYEIFWGESRTKYKERLNGHLPLMLLELRPGLTEIPLP